MPYRRAPDGPTHTAIGIGRVGDALEQRLHLVAADDRPAGVDLEHERLGAVGRRRASMASSIASTTIGSNSPLTWSTSTGPGAAAGPRRPGRDRGRRAQQRRAAAPSRPISSLRKGASGERRSSAGADRLTGDDRGGQRGCRQDHGNGGSRPCGSRRRPPGARRRARRQAGARRARRRPRRARRSSPRPRSRSTCATTASGGSPSGCRRRA